jgi:hypothetical protein
VIFNCLLIAVNPDSVIAEPFINAFTVWKKDIISHNITRTMP